MSGQDEHVGWLSIEDQAVILVREFGLSRTRAKAWVAQSGYEIVTSTRPEAVSVDALAAAEARGIAMGREEAAPNWRHVRRGSIYVERGRGLLQSSAGPVSEGATLVAYQDETGRWWFREQGEFEDGRFAALPAPAAMQAADATTPDEGEAV